jgi:hypothetical protein
MPPSPVIFGLKPCPRCGQDHLAEESVSFQVFAKPPQGFSHWAKCPTNGEPIMLCLFANSIDHLPLDQRTPEHIDRQEKLALLAEVQALRAAIVPLAESAGWQGPSVQSLEVFLGERYGPGSDAVHVGQGYFAPTSGTPSSVWV